MCGRIFVIFLLIKLTLGSPFPFECAENGQEIDLSLACDGKRDCLHGSDESFMVCKNLDVPRTFACAYGAGILHYKECNDVIDCADGSDEHANCEIHNSTIRGGCNEGEFECYSGECFEMHKMCDGKIDCVDGRDESPNLCMGTIAGEDHYQCANGVWISHSKCCDNKFDCIDGSDEIPILCEYNEEWKGNAPKPCVEPIDKGLRFDGITAYHENRTHRFVYPNQLTRFKCYDKSSKMEGTEWNVCLITGEWRNDTRCSIKKPNYNKDTNGTNGCVIDKYDENLLIKKCDPFKCVEEVRPPINNMIVEFSCKGNTTLVPSKVKNSKLQCLDKKWINKGFDEDVECKNQCDGTQISCYDTLVPHCSNPRLAMFYCQKMMPAGTVVTFECKIGLRKSPNPLNVTCQDDGTWTDRSALKDYCTEVCGNIEAKYTFISKNAPNLSSHLSPWTVPIYIKNGTSFSRQCTGTRIKRNLVLTAAHCVHLRDSQMIRVGNATSMLTIMDKDNGLDLVDRIYIYPGFTADPVGGDIALIKLTRSNKDYVPKGICLPWIFSNDYHSSILPNFTGDIATWETTSLTSSANLTFAIANVVPENSSSTSDLFKVAIRYNSQICAGDSGSGFIGGCRGRSSQSSSFHCLYGVVSNAKEGLDTDNCSKNIQATDIYIHRDFINQYMEQDDDYCPQD